MERKLIAYCLAAAVLAGAATAQASPTSPDAVVAGSVEIFAPSSDLFAGLASPGEQALEEAEAIKLAGPARRSMRRTARRTSRRTARRVNRRQDYYY